MTRANPVVAVTVAVALAAAAGCGDSNETDIRSTGVFEVPPVAGGEKRISDEEHDGGTGGQKDSAENFCCMCLETTSSGYAGGAEECAGRLVGGLPVAYSGASFSGCGAGVKDQPCRTLIMIAKGVGVEFWKAASPLTDIKDLVFYAEAPTLVGRDEVKIPAGTPVPQHAGAMDAYLVVNSGRSNKVMSTKTAASVNNWYVACAGTDWKPGQQPAVSTDDCSDWYVPWIEIDGQGNLKPKKVEVVLMGFDQKDTVTVNLSPSTHDGYVINAPRGDVPSTHTDDFSFNENSNGNQMTIYPAGLKGGNVVLTLYSKDNAAEATIDYSTNTGKTGSLKIPVDSDLDHLPDAWEKKVGLNPYSYDHPGRDDENAGGAHTTIGDGFILWEEYRGLQITTDSGGGNISRAIKRFDEIDNDLGSSSIGAGKGGYTVKDLFFIDELGPLIVLNNHVDPNVAANLKVGFHKLDKKDLQVEPDSGLKHNHRVNFRAIPGNIPIVAGAQHHQSAIHLRQDSIGDGKLGEAQSTFVDRADVLVDYVEVWRTSAGLGIPYGDLMKFAVYHEIGHKLGLEHNMGMSDVFGPAEFDGQPFDLTYYWNRNVVTSGNVDEIMVSRRLYSNKFVEGNFLNLVQGKTDVVSSDELCEQLSLSGVVAALESAGRLQRVAPDGCTLKLAPIVAYIPTEFDDARHEEVSKIYIDPRSLFQYPGAGQRSARGHVMRNELMDWRPILTSGQLPAQRSRPLIGYNFIKRRIGLQHQVIVDPVSPATASSSGVDDLVKPLVDVLEDDHYETIVVAKILSEPYERHVVHTRADKLVPIPEGRWSGSWFDMCYNFPRSFENLYAMTVDIEVVEVLRGQALNEGEIVRYDFDFGRSEGAAGRLPKGKKSVFEKGGVRVLALSRPTDLFNYNTGPNDNIRWFNGNRYRDVLTWVKNYLAGVRDNPLRPLEKPLEWPPFEDYQPTTPEEREKYNKEFETVVEAKRVETLLRKVVDGGRADSSPDSGRAADGKDPVYRVWAVVVGALVLLLVVGLALRKLKKPKGSR